MTEDEFSGDFVLIAGSMKCGTTTLFDLLGAHPEVSKSQVKEPNLFVKEDDRFGPKSLDDLWPDYDPHLHQWRLEASTAYSKRHLYEGVGKRIVRAAKNGARFKILLLVRDPVERIRSHITYLWSTPDGPDPGDEDQLSLHVVLTSMYAAQLRIYEEHLPGQIHVETLGRLNSKSSQAIDEILRFLEIDRATNLAQQMDRKNATLDRRKREGMFWRLAWSKAVPTHLIGMLPRSLKDFLDRTFSSPVDWKYAIPERYEPYLADILGEDSRELCERYSLDPGWSVLEDLRGTINDGG